MKTKNEILTNPNFLNLSYTCYNLKVYKKGSHNAAMISGLGRCFAESKKQQSIPVRVEVGQADVLYLFQYLGCNYMSKFQKENKPEMEFKFSNSGASLYLTMNKTLYLAILETLKFYPFK